MFIVIFVVVGCSKLKDTEWISRQDPYVCLEYASTKHRTKTCTGTDLCTYACVSQLMLEFNCLRSNDVIILVELALFFSDGGKNPKFQEKFVFPLIEGLRELNVVVWNSNTITLDDFIGSGK